MVLDALGQKAGPEDTRTAAQRRHDAVEEACRRLISGQMIPGRDGQPPHLTVHIDLNDLRRQPGGSVLERSWTPAMAAAGPGSVYLTGAAAEAAACDAVLTTIVTGQIDWQVLDQLTTVWLTAHGHGHASSPPDDHPAGPPETRRTDRGDNPAAACRKTTRTGRKKTPRTADRKTTRTAPAGRPRGRARRKTPRTGRRDDQADGRPDSRDADQPAASTGHPPGSGSGPFHGPSPVPFPGSGPFHGYVPFPGTGHGPGPGEAPAAAGDHDCGIAGCLEATRRRLQATILRWSLDLLSGPGGLASHLRGTLLGAPFNTLSQPLDIGRTTRTIPPHLRTAVIQRDQHCQFPGCTQPPSVCEVHHLIPWAKGGPTSLGNLRLLCRFHHLIVIHRWRWTITCHPDGTTTATAPDGRTLHSHGPPQQAA